MATKSYGDSFDPSREQIFTRAACAELLIDAGAVVAPSVCDVLIASGTKGLLALFHRSGIFPQARRFFAAVGVGSAVRGGLDANGDDREVVNREFICAWHLQPA